MLRGILRSGAFGQHLGFSGPRAAVRYPCAIKQCRSVADAPGRAQQFTRRTDIDVALLVEREVFPAERTVLAPRHALPGMCGAIFFSSTIERFGRAIGRVGGNTDFAISRPIVAIDCMLAPPNRGSFNSPHVYGTHVPVEEPSTASIGISPGSFNYIVCAGGTVSA